MGRRAYEPLQKKGKPRIGGARGAPSSSRGGLFYLMRESLGGKGFQSNEGKVNGDSARGKEEANR